jgi:hypothetical protein
VLGKHVNPYTTMTQQLSIQKVAATILNTPTNIKIIIINFDKNISIMKAMKLLH